MLDFLFYEQLAWPAKQMKAWFKEEKAVRIGQSSVVSHKLHTMDPAHPEEIKVMQALDAGQVFYRRQDCNAIFHMDIFHQCGLIDHRQVAKAIKRNIDIYNFHQSVQNGALISRGATMVMPDWIDVQTGVGGGRVTGSLEYGKKASLRKAHENHIHIAAMIPDEHMASLFYLVQAVEEVILEAGLELRANEKITHDSSVGNGQTDLSAYSDCSDSYLIDKNRNESPIVRKQQYLQDTADLMEEFDSAREIKEFLQTVEHQSDQEKLSKNLEAKGHSRQVLNWIAGMGIVTIEKNRVTLSRYGRDYKEYMEKFLPDVENYIKRFYRLLKPQTENSGKSKDKPCPAQHHGIQGQWLAAAERDPKTSLAIAETIQAVAKRAGQRITAPLKIMAGDLRYHKRVPRLKNEICILIDTSASMAGSRIRAAKFLIRHLLLSLPDRICVVTFHENIASVQVPFTRDYRQVEEKLKNVKAFGSTPLGLGLTACNNYLTESKPHNPLILLITDGMPTFSEGSRDPVSDALMAAQDIKKKKFGFACIGLKPHYDYLQKLSDAAGGKMYIVEELDRQALVKTVWTELQR
nr:VWA domain-containing protein [Acetonema longum]